MVTEKDHGNSLQCSLESEKELEEQYCREDFHGIPRKSMSRLSIIRGPIYPT